jgi:RNA polymerase sigma factor (sigma-70 family)
VTAPSTLDERNAQIEALVPLVRKVARKVARMIPSAEPDDLLGDGYVGLMRAVDGFDPRRGEIEPYAMRVVEGAMINGVRKRQPVSTRVRRAVREADRLRFRIAEEEGRLPTLTEIERLRPDLRAALLKAHRHHPLSLDGQLPPEERPPLAAEDPEQIAIARAVHDTLIDATRTLGDRHRLVISMHYFHGLTIQQVGETLGVTPQRASQLHRAAIDALRAALGAEA